MNIKNFLIYLFAFLVFFFSTIYITFPLIFNMGNLTTGFGDELLIAYIHNWVIHALSTNPLSLFDANIYYPYNTTLAYSDLFLTSSMLSFIPLKITGQPIAAVNFTLISSLIFLGFSTFILCFYITRNFLSSLLSGLLVIFSPAVLDKKVHLQILSIYWVPLSMVSFLHFIKTFKTKYLLLSMLFFLLQTYNSFLPGYFLVFFYITAIIYVYLYSRKICRKIFILKNILIVSVAFLLLIPVVIPYYKVSRKFNSVRDIRDSIHFALQPEDFLSTNEHSKLSYVINPLANKLRPHPVSGEIKSGYLGLIFTVLTICSVVYFFKKIKKKYSSLDTFTITALVGLLLSLGPVLHLQGQTIHKPFPIIMPYTLFYYILPGFKGFRNSGRWEMLFIICISVSISIVLSHLLSSYNQKFKVIIYFLLITGTIWEFNYPMKFFPIIQKEHFPKVHRFLSTTPANSKVIIMPIYNWNMSSFASEELKRDYYSTIHFRKTVGGYSGFSPPPWQEMVYSLMSSFPNNDSITNIKKLGVQFVIIDKKEYEKLNSQHYKVNNHIISDIDTIIQSLLANKSLYFVDNIEDYYIFKFNE